MQDDWIARVVVFLAALACAYACGRMDGWFARSKAELKRVHPDTVRLDWLDGRCAPYIEAQSQSWPYGEHTANEWALIWPETSIRAGIDAAIAEARTPTGEQP